MKREFLALGLMSGTSMDGIDAVLARFGDGGDETLAHTFTAYPKALRQQLFEKLKDFQISLEEYGVLNHLVGESFAKAALACLKQAKQRRKANRADVIGSHGQTIFHNPGKKVSLQIGSPHAIARATGITTVSNFRLADIYAGGEGAPMLPLYHQRMIGKKHPGFAVHNLGGISNFTYFGPGKKLIALDTGPANCLMDLCTQRLSQGKIPFDAKGKWASAGNISLAHLAYLHGQDAVRKYISLPAPKSTGRELFTQSMADAFIERAQNDGLSKEDMLATLSQFSVDLAVLAYERFVRKKKLPLHSIVFCGGGAHNPDTLRRFSQAMPQVKIQTLADFGMEPQVIEAQAFACYGLMSVFGLPQNLPAATGASQAVVGGEITPGANWRALYLKVHSASQKSVSFLL